jgi:membrane associated rhomboid family serine protease
LRNQFMLSRDNIRQGRVWTILTHSITHIELFHLISNSIGLYFFGG